MDKENISSRQIAMAFTGSFLGAGFVSGQELMQFFAVFGTFGLIGMGFSIMLLCLLGSFVMKIANQTGFVEFDKIIVEKKNPWLRGFFGGVFVFFLFGVVVVMLAGAGALLNQVFGLPLILGNIIMAILLTIVALWEARGVLAAFSITVPLLIVVAMLTAILSFFYFKDIHLVPRPFSEANPLLGNWFFSMIAFVSYNMIAGISILVPIGVHVKDEKTIQKGISRGTVQLGMVFVSILLPLTIHQTMLAETNLPMLTLAEKIHPALGTAYAILLLFGMFGSALSCLFGVTVRIRKVKNISGRTLTIALGSIAFACSIVGFKELIATLFPICGYIGFFAMIGIVQHYISLQKKISMRRNKEDLL